MLTKRYNDIDTKISRAFDLFVEGKFENDIWEAKNDQWKLEKIEIQQSLDTIELDNDAFMNEGIRLMELASEAHDLFDHMTSDEKRRIAHLVLSNPQIENGSLRYDFKNHFLYSLE